jgi:hypothetical protein
MSNPNAFHGQSTKEMYKSDIETSRNQKTTYLIYEFLDDYSYSDASMCGILFKKNKSKTAKNSYIIIFFMNDGPKTCVDMRKMLEWRRSGKSDEIGHKGGGNKRNIYGHESVKTTLISRLDEDSAIFAETAPDKIYNLSTSDIDETNFRKEVDSSEYVKVPETKNVEDAPRWYETDYNEIQKESKIKPNFMIRMELSAPKLDYTDKVSWDALCKQIGAKQYDIPIYFKNEFLDNKKYIECNTIDLIGLQNEEHKLDKKMVVLMIDQYGKFYIKHESFYIDILTGNEIEIKDGFIHWGDIEMFIYNKPNFDKQLKIFNKDLTYPLKAEECYGIYISLNGKLTNYKPLDGNLLGAGKNNGIEDVSCGNKNTNRFRMIIRPNQEECKDETILTSLLITNTIKASTQFLDKSPYKKIIHTALSIYKGKFKQISVVKQSAVISPKPKSINKETKPGGYYIVYFGYGLWKFGYVNNYTQITKRINTHYNESIQYRKQFCDKNVEEKYAIPFCMGETKSPKGSEEKINHILNEYRCEKETNDEKIILWESKRSKNEDREFFICNDVDYMLFTVIPEVKQQLNKLLIVEEV